MDKTLEIKLMEFVEANREEIFKQGRSESNLTSENTAIPIIDSYIESLDLSKSQKWELHEHFYYMVLPDVDPVMYDELAEW